MYGVQFAGILLTGLGSAYYHNAPDNNSLVYDRLPMTLVFMAFLSSAIGAWIDIDAGSKLLVPFLLLGAGSVIYWHYTELQGMGDLRFYAFIQYFPMVLIPFIFLLFKGPVNNKGLYLLVYVIAWYVTAKLLETFDGKNLFRHPFYQRSFTKTSGRRRSYLVYRKVFRKKIYHKLSHHKI